MSKRGRQFIHNMSTLAFACAACVCFGGRAVAETAVTIFPVPSVTILVGDVLTDDLLVDRKLIANTVALRTHHTSRSTIVGKVARRILPAGAAIPLNGLREVHAFREGERVSIEFTHGGLSIRGSGIALQTGLVGQDARVRNVDTGVVLSGLVQRDGSIAIGSGLP